MTRGSRERLLRRLRHTRAEGRGLLSVYLIAGHPDPGRSPAYFDAALAGGADWLEVGIPFSDPVADGPALQRASVRALGAGATVAGALDLARGLRARHPDAPLVAMTYGNLVLRRGWDAFARDLRDHGVDGLIVPDVPLEEAGPLSAGLAAAGLAHIPLVAPTTGLERMRRIAATCTGFLYVVANVGVTGQSDPGPLAAATVARAREAAPGVPRVAGFGIRTPEDLRRVLAAGADGGIVGSEAVGRVEAGASPEELRRWVAALRAAT